MIKAFIISVFVFTGVSGIQNQNDNQKIAHVKEIKAKKIKKAKVEKIKSALVTTGGKIKK